MSTVHVALLKAIIDQGPESNNYYTISIVLIALSLILQVLAGLLSLLISKIRSFYTNHRYVHEIYDCDLQIFFNMMVMGSQQVTWQFFFACTGSMCLRRSVLVRVVDLFRRRMACFTSNYRIMSIGKQFQGNFFCTFIFQWSPSNICHRLIPASITLYCRGKRSQYARSFRYSYSAIHKSPASRLLGAVGLNAPWTPYCPTAYGFVNSAVTVWYMWKNVHFKIGSNHGIVK